MQTNKNGQISTITSVPLSNEHGQMHSLEGDACQKYYSFTGPTIKLPWLK